MDSKILQSIVEITRHRDLDSLEFAFIGTLRELVPARSIVLLRLVRADRIDSAEEVVHLEVTDNGRGEVSYTWNKESRILATDRQLQHCLRSGGACQQHETETGYRLIVPIGSNNRILGALTLESPRALESYRDLVDAFARIYGNYMAVLHESEHDNLTGLLNRRTFDNKLTRLLAAQRETHEEFDPRHAEFERRHDAEGEASWLAVVDVDHFKRINDSFGHVYGDEILLVLSQMMRESFRKTDLLFRVGGEEFVVILSPLSAEGAQEALDRFRAEVAEHDFPSVGRVTVSIGYARITEGAYPRRVFDLADKALYFAKDHGRNATFCYESLLADGRLVEEDTSGSIELF